MNKKVFHICVLLMCVFLFVSCHDNSDSELKQMGYKVTFPEKMSPALLTFIKQHLTANNGIFIMEQDHESIYAKVNNNSESNSIQYFSVRDNDIEESLAPLLGESDVETEFRELTGDENNNLIHEINASDYDALPEITLEKDNKLHVNTQFGEEDFYLPDVLEEFDVNPTDELIVNAHTTNKDEFSIVIQNLEQDDDNQFIFLFIKQDFSDIVAVKSYEDEFQQSVVTGELNRFEKSVFKTESSNEYNILFDQYGVLDRDKDAIYTVDEQDLQSVDDYYVYLNGAEDPLSEGDQRIQKIEEYIEESENDYAAFNLDYEEISNELELKSANEVLIGKPYYFNNDFLVLFLDFKAPIAGGAGSTNVIIDFQEDKENPTIHLVNLGLH